MAIIEPNRLLDPRMLIKVFMKHLYTQREKMTDDAFLLVLELLPILRAATKVMFDRTILVVSTPVMLHAPAT